MGSEFTTESCEIKAVDSTAKAAKMTARDHQDYGQWLYYHNYVFRRYRDSIEMNPHPGDVWQLLGEDENEVRPGVIVITGCSSLDSLSDMETLQAKELACLIADRRERSVVHSVSKTVHADTDFLTGDYTIETEPVDWKRAAALYKRLTADDSPSI